MLTRKQALRLLNNSLKAEEKAYEIYIKQSENSDEKIRKFFLSIAKEERKHMNMVSEIIKKLEKSNKKIM